MNINRQYIVDKLNLLAESFQKLLYEEEDETCIH